MVAGEAPGVRELARAADLPVPPPPGVVVVRAGDPWDVAADLVRRVGATRLFTVAEASDELDRRRDAAVTRARLHRDRCAADAEAAGRRAGAAFAALPPALAGVAPARLRRAARALEEADASLRAARRALGRRPHVDEEAAHEAREAQVLVDVARLHRAALLPRANRVLAVANAGAVAIVVGRVVSEAFDPVFVLVAVLPLGALGVVTTMVGQTVRRSRSAARRRWAALRSLDVCTLAALDAREAEARAWDTLAAQVAERRRDLVRAREAWETLVGPGVPVSRAASMAGSLEEAVRLRADADEAARAGAEASERLQATEDTGSEGGPLVVIAAGADPAGHADLLGGLAERAGRSPVVVVSPTVAATDVPPPPLVGPGTPRRPVAASGPSADTSVVDLRERVLAALVRLRSPRRDPSPPGSVAG